MDRERFQRIETLFDAAADLAAPERGRYLEEACAGDEELLLEVRRLLERVDRPLEVDGAPPAGGTPGAFAPPGTRIGRFVLREPLGEGGFGLVYRAEQERPLRREVALKIVKPGMDSRRVLARFESERQALARMDHPHIARVIDAGENEQGRPYFVMDLVDGIAITTFCDERGLDVKGRLDLFLQVIAAVQHAHQRGIIHRDLKPSNILVADRDGAPSCRVIDFGIAKAMDTSRDGPSGMTVENQLVGTPAYMSPEQAAGSLDVDTRADIYALGVLLYELLTGTTPHGDLELARRSSSDISRLIREDEPPRPSTRLARRAARPGEAGDLARDRRRAIRGDLDWIVMKAIEKDPARRYETAQRLADDVRRHLADAPVLARPPGLRYRTAKFVRRHRIAVAAAALVGFALLLGAALASAGFVSASRDRDRALDRLYDSLTAQARMIRQGNHRGRRAQSLELVAQAASIRPTPELRNEAIAGLALTDIELVRRMPLTSAPGANATTRGLREKSRFAVAEPDHVVVVRNVAEGAVIARLRGPPVRPWVLVFSPSGRYLAVKHHEGSTVHLVVWEVASATQVLALRDVPNMLGCIDFASDESWLAVGDPGGRVLRYDLSTAALAGTIDLDGPPVSISVVPRARWLAVAVAGETAVRFYDAERGGVVQSIETFEPVVEVRSSRDGALVATASPAGPISIWEREGGRLRTTLHGHQGRPRLLEFDHASARLASSAWDATTRLWDLATGAATAEPFRGSTLVGLGDDLLLIDDDEIAVWRRAASPVLRQIPLSGDRGDNPHVEIAPGGRLCALGGDGGVRVIDLAARAEVGPLVSEIDSYSLCFTPNGDRLIGGTEAGLLAWTVERRDDAITIGAPRRLLDSGRFTRACVTADGTQALVCGPSRAQLVDLAGAGPTATLAAEGLWGCRPSASSDGRWFFTGAWRAPPARVWDAHRREVVLEFAGTSIAGCFGPRSRWLGLAKGPTYRFIEAGTWAERWRFERASETNLAGPLAFDPRGAIAAIALAFETVSLVNLETGRIVAELPGPPGERAMSLAFAPDGATLVAASRARGPLFIWDLRALRGELARLGLDWDLPPLPAAPPPVDERPIRLVPPRGSELPEAVLDAAL